MKVIQINACYGYASTGTIVKDIRECCERNGMECYVAFPAGCGTVDAHCIEIGCALDRKIHSLFSHITGKESYFSFFATRKFLKRLDQIKPDVVHLHNLHNHYISLPMLLRYLAKHSIKTVVTMHDCWYFTGGCTHYVAAGCTRWQAGCGNCPKRKSIPSWFKDSTAEVLADRIKLFSAIPDVTFVGASQWVADELRKSPLADHCKITHIHNGFDLDTFKPRSDSRIQDSGEIKPIPSGGVGVGHKVLSFGEDLGEAKILLGPASKWLSPINKPTLDYFLEHLTQNEILLLFGATPEQITHYSHLTSHSSHPTPPTSHPSDKVRPPHTSHLTSHTSHPSDKVRPTLKLYGFTRNREELAELYSAADVFVNCSWEDTLSSLNIEAQACGTPVVTYDSTGSKETVDGEVSVHVKSGDYETLFAKTMEILSRGKQGDACRQWAQEEFSKQNYEQYLKI